MPGDSVAQWNGAVDRAAKWHKAGGKWHGTVEEWHKKGQWHGAGRSATGRTVGMLRMHGYDTGIHYLQRSNRPT